MNLDLLDRYLELLPFFLVAFILSLLITPWVGRLAFRIGAVDLPPDQRKANDQTRSRRVHRHIPALLGGVGMIVSLMITLLVLSAIDNFQWGVILGLVVVLIFGFLDDLYDLRSTEILFFQVLAAFLVVLSGISVTSIQVAGVFVDFHMFSTSIEIGEFIYNFIFPADLLTIVWIVGLMNVMNWVGGVDGLNGAVSSIISVAMLLIAMKLGLILPAMFLAAHVGAVLGVLPYNYHLSKIFYGSSGDFGNGYILAVMSILAGTKLPLFLVMAGLPFFDALVVFSGRVYRNKSLLRKPWQILSVNDKSHFHHRLLDLGFSHKLIVLVESAITVFLAAIALYLSDFRLDTIALVIAAAVMMIIISLLALSQRRRKARLIEQKQLEAQKPAVNITVRHQKQETDQYKY